MQIVRYFAYHICISVVGFLAPVIPGLIMIYIIPADVSGVAPVYNYNALSAMCAIEAAIIEMLYFGVGYKENTEGTFTVKAILRIAALSGIYLLFIPVLIIPVESLIWLYCSNMPLVAVFAHLFDENSDGAMSERIRYSLILVNMLPSVFILLGYYAKYKHIKCGR